MFGLSVLLTFLALVGVIGGAILVLTLFLSWLDRREAGRG